MLKACCSSEVCFKTGTGQVESCVLVLLLEEERTPNLVNVWAAAGWSLVGVLGGSWGVQKWKKTEREGEGGCRCVGSKFISSTSQRKKWCLIIMKTVIEQVAA